MKNTMQILVFFLFFLFNVYADILAISREIDLNSEKIENAIKLDGDWEFYPNQFLNFQDFRNNYQTVKKSKTVIQIPENFFNSVFTSKEKIHYGTYRLKIVLKSFSNLNRYEYINFYIPEILSSYNLFINDKLYIENGKISKKFFQFQPSNLKQLLVISTTDVFSQIGSSFDLILHVSNFDYFNVGIIKPIYFFISEIPPQLYEKNGLIVFSLVVSIVGIIMTLLFSYFINRFYLQYPEANKNIFYLFLITCLIFLFGLFSLSIESYFFPFKFQFDILFLKEFKFWIIIFTVLLFIRFFNHFLGKPVPEKKVLFITIASIVLLGTISFIFHFSNFFSLGIFFLFIYLIFFVLCWFLINISYRFTFQVKYTGSGWLFLSSIFILSGVIMDLILTLYIPIFSLQPTLFFLVSCYILSFLIVTKMFLSMKLGYMKKHKRTIKLNLDFLPNHLLEEDKEEFPNIQYTRKLSGVLFCISLNEIDLSKENDSFLFSGLEIIFNIIKKQKGHILKASSNYFLFAFFESWEDAIHSSIFIQRELSRKEGIYTKKLKVFIGMEYFKSGLILNYVGSPENLSLNLFSLSFLKSVKKVYQKAKDFNLKVVIGPDLFKVTNVDTSRINSGFYRESGTLFSYIPILRTTMPVTGDRVNLYELLFSINGDIVMRNKAIVSFYYHKAYEFLVDGNTSQAFSMYKHLKSFNPDDQSLDTFLKFSLDCLKEPVKLYTWF